MLVYHYMFLIMLYTGAISVIMWRDWLEYKRETILGLRKGCGICNSLNREEDDTEEL